MRIPREAVTRNLPIGGCANGPTRTVRTARRSTSFSPRAQSLTSPTPVSAPGSLVAIS